MKAPRISPRRLICLLLTAVTTGICLQCACPGSRQADARHFTSVYQAQAYVAAEPMVPAGKPRAAAPALAEPVGFGGTLGLPSLWEIITTEFTTVELAAAGAVSIPTAACPSAEVDPAQQYLELARGDPERLLEIAVERWQDVEGYRLKLLSQERLDGRLRHKTVIEAAVMSEPYAVSFRWLSNPGAIDRLLWMPSAYGQELLVHPTGLAGKLVDHVGVDPRSKRVRNSTRRDVTRFGLAQTLESLLEDYRRGRQAGTLVSEPLGLVTCPHSGAPAIGLKRTTTDQTSEVQVTLVYLSSRDLRPLLVRQLGAQDQLLGDYAFTDYQPAALSAGDFSVENVFDD